MATHTLDESETELPRGAPPRMNWGAIFGGTVAALGLWLLLYTLGLAVGLSSVDPANAGSVRGSGIFTGLWSLLSPLIALFVGGLVAGRTAGVRRRADGAVHGLVLWGLTTVLGLYLLSQALSALVGGMASIGRTAVQAGGAAVAGAASGAGQAGGVAQSFGLDADDALRPVNERLAREGKPPVSAEQMQAATRDVVQGAVRQGSLDRGRLVSSLAKNTALSRKDADEVATRVEQQFSAFSSSAQQRLGQAAESVQTGALKAADATGKAFWGLFGALFLGLVSAVLGASAGSFRTPRRLGLGFTRRVVPGSGAPPGPGRREVYR